MRGGRQPDHKVAGVAVDPRTPVIIGVGQVTQRPDGVDPPDPESPDATALMAEAIHLALSDAGGLALGRVDALAVVNTLSWRYGDPARLVADRAGLNPRRRVVTPMGGNSPQALVNATATSIAAGEIDLAVLTGGETWRTRMRARRAEVALHWPRVDDDLIAAAPPEVWGGELTMNSDHETSLGVYMPVQIYPLFESAIRARRGAEGIDPVTHLEQVAAMWAHFSEVAASNPHAWSRHAMTPTEVMTPGPSNRMVGAPYTKVMNSNNDVDMAAALIMCSAERASALGVPRERWVFPHSGTDCHEHPLVSERDRLDEVPAVRAGADLALHLAGITIDDVDLIDLYSCFPSAVQLGARAIGLDPYGTERTLTLTGGLSFMGGPWNNYVMHAIATAVERLRADGERALIWANGGYVTKHSFGVYGSRPPTRGFRSDSPQKQVDTLPRRRCVTGKEAAGEARLESHTVMHDRDGLPERAIATVITDGGERAWALSEVAEVVTELADGDHVGRLVTVDADARLHL